MIEIRSARSGNRCVSHLDVETEKAVNAALSELAIARLVVVITRPSGRRGGSSPSKAAWRGSSPAKPLPRLLQPFP
jgi:hypothetical protein